MKKGKKSPKTTSAPCRVVRIFVGERTAEQLVADLVKIHNAA